MLLTEEEMAFDFGSARLTPERDRDLLRFVFSQYLYGEVTGIQVGHWLYAAPDLEAARFLARQAVEEMQHVGNFIRILGLLGMEPQEAHPLVRFLATGMMGRSWSEHLVTEMALGEGFVLNTMLALIDVLDHPEAVAILRRALRQEESHVAFGEARTLALIRADPTLREPLLGRCLTWLWGAERLGDFMARKIDPSHPVLTQVPAFTAHTLRCAELRIQRMGLCDVPPRTLPLWARAKLVAKGQSDQVRRQLKESLHPGQRKRRLTAHYLTDPTLRSLLREATEAGIRAR